MVLVLGTLGYMIVEGWGLFDALYMTVITVSTVGYQEVANLSPGGRVLTLVIITLGISLVAYAMTGILEDEVENRIRQVMGRRRLDKQTGKLKNHVIVCGYGRMGRILSEELARIHEPFAVIELSNDERVVSFVINATSSPLKKGAAK